MSALGIIFSDIHEWEIGELDRHRTAASLPFGGRYRLIDFVLSHMVNSGIYDIGLITKTNYQSLMNHIGSGKDWDLSRKNGGIMIYPPYSGGESEGLYTGRLDALKRVLKFLKSSNHDYVVMTDCDMLCNIDYRDVIDYHIESGADITAVYAEEKLNKARSVHSILYQVSESGRVVDVSLYPEVDGTFLTSLNTWVMSKEYLLKLVADSQSHGLTKFSRDILATNCSHIKIMGYHYQGYRGHIESLESYLECNLDMLDLQKRNALFCRPIYTNVRDTKPTRYGNSAHVKNSLIADGCTIEGTVENSVIFRGVHIGKQCVVKNSILMQDTQVGEHANLDWIITDRGVVIRENRLLSAFHSCPFYIEKEKVV